MARWTILTSMLLLTGCPTAKEISWTVVPAAHTMTVRMHDVRSDDGSSGDWATAAGLLAMIAPDGPGTMALADGVVHAEEVDGALDLVASYTVDDAALQSLLPRSKGVALWCEDGAVLATDGHDLTDVLGKPCVAWEEGQQTYAITVDGGAADGDLPQLDAWRAAGAPAVLDPTRDDR